MRPSNISDRIRCNSHKIDVLECEKGDEVLVYLYEGAIIDYEIGRSILFYLLRSTFIFFIL
jgi:hypothetical protein